MGMWESTILDLGFARACDAHHGQKQVERDGSNLTNRAGTASRENPAHKEAGYSNSVRSVLPFVEDIRAG